MAARKKAAAKPAEKVETPEPDQVDVNKPRLVSDDDIPESLRPGSTFASRAKANKSKS